MNTAALFPGERVSTSVLLKPGHAASVRFQWSNWCNPAHPSVTSTASEGRRPTQILVALAPGARGIVATIPGGLHRLYLPVCIAPGTPSRIAVSLWTTGS